MRKNKSAALIVFCAALVCLIVFVSVLFAAFGARTFISSFTFKDFAREQHEKSIHNAQGISSEDCLSESGFNLKEIVFEAEKGNDLYLVFTTEYGDIYEAYVEKTDDNGQLIYQLINWDDANTATQIYGELHELGGDWAYACVDVTSYVRKHDFEGYIPQVKDVTVVKNDEEKTYHFYFIDKSQEPYSSYNYAPVYALFSDEKDIITAIEVCNAAMEVDSDTTPQDFAKVIGADAVDELPSSDADTYDYKMKDSGFTLRSKGVPIESFTISTAYDSVTIDVDAKKIKSNR